MIEGLKSIEKFKDILNADNSNLDINSVLKDFFIGSIGIMTVVGGVISCKILNRHESYYKDVTSKNNTL